MRCASARLMPNLQAFSSQLMKQEIAAAIAPNALIKRVRQKHVAGERDIVKNDARAGSGLPRKRVSLIGDATYTPDPGIVPITRPAAHHGVVGSKCFDEF